MLNVKQLSITQLLAWSTLLLVGLAAVSCDSASGSSEPATATPPATVFANLAPTATTVAQAAIVATITPTLDPNDPCAEQRRKMNDPGFMGGRKDEWYIHASLASCYEQANDNERAIAEHKEAIRFGSFIVVGDSYLNLAQLYKKMNRLDDALATYLVMTQLKPDQPNLDAKLIKMQSEFNQQMGYSGAAGIYVIKRLYREAVDAYSKAISFDPSAFTDIEARGDVYVALGENDKAIADYTYILENDGKPFIDGAGMTHSTSLGPEGTEHLKQKLQALGANVSAITPYPKPTGMPMMRFAPPLDYRSPTPKPPLPTATP